MKKMTRKQRQDLYNKVNGLRPMVKEAITLFTDGKNIIKATNRVYVQTAAGPWVRVA